MNDTELLKKIHAQVKNHRKKNLSNQLISEILDHKFDDFSASNAKRVVELEKQNAELRKQRDELNKQCGEFQEGFFEYMGWCDHLQIEVEMWIDSIDVEGDE